MRDAVWRMPVAHQFAQKLAIAFATTFWGQDITAFAIAAKRIARADGCDLVACTAQAAGDFGTKPLFIQKDQPVL